jgi:Holliday junction resolvasome RuvABC endonuclease subunit
MTTPPTPEANTIFIGIDYSMTSPGICVMDHSGNIDIYALCDSHVDKKCYKEGKFTFYTLKDKEPWKTPIERFDRLARKVLAIINRYDLGEEKPIIYIEGYSMASKGQVFHIAENAAVLKHYFFQVGLKYREIAPTTLKKFATGSGRAQKEDMHDAFMKETGIDLKGQITPNRKLGSPVTDLIDAYYLAKYGKQSRGVKVTTDEDQQEED